MTRSDVTLRTFPCGVQLKPGPAGQPCCHNELHAALLTGNVQGIIKAYLANLEYLFVIS
jgi:hypothetical protein